MSDPVPRAPLRIPGGWTVSQNELREIIPELTPPGHDDWQLLCEDLLQIERRDGRALLDVGWYPDGSPDGQFVLKLIPDRDWSAPVAKFTTRDLTELIAEVERLLVAPVEIPPARLLEQLADPRPEVRVRAAEDLARQRVVDAAEAIRDAYGREHDLEAMPRLQAAMQALIQERRRRG